MIPPEKSVVLAPGITLHPIKKKISVFDLAAAGSVGFSAWALLQPITYGTSLCEIEAQSEYAVAPGYDALGRASLASVLLMLRGYAMNICYACSAYSWQELADAHKGESKLQPFRGGLLDYHAKALKLNYNNNGPVTQEDASWINENFEKCNQLIASNEAFRLAIEAIRDCRFTNDKRIAIARLWTGIEAIFAINSSELKYRISLLLAFILTDCPGEDRKKVFQKIKKLYDLRSAAVHGSKMTDERLRYAFNESYKLLSQLL